MTVEASSEIEVFKQEGNQYFSAGDFVKAVAAYNKAIKADPQNGVLYSNRAAAFIHLGKEVKAIKDAEQAIELKPDWAKGYFRKGAALLGLRKWDEAIEALKAALELEPKSREISTMLREAQRKRSVEKGEKKREDSKGLKLIASDKDMPSTGKGSEGGKAAAVVGAGGISISETVIEQFVKSALTSAVTQFSQSGELKSIVYMQPASEEEGLQMVGIEAGFDSPQANEQCCEFLRGYAADNKAVAVVVMAEKRNIAFPQVWKEKTSAQWSWKSNEQGIFMQLDAMAATTSKGTKAPERKVFFIPTGVTGKNQVPSEPVELPIDLFAIMPPLLR